MAHQKLVKVADMPFGDAAAGGMLPPTPPNAAYQPMPGSSDAGSSTSSATFPYLPSGSPQLPFAFTPSPHSLPTLAGQVRSFMLDNANHHSACNMLVSIRSDAQAWQSMTRLPKQVL